MTRLILALQYPVRMRYQYWWYQNLPLELEKYFDKVIVLGHSFIIANRLKSPQNGNFSVLQEAVNFELSQIKQYMEMSLQSGDTLFLADLSFPGFFANTLFHKRPDKIYAFCHATAKNRYDLFASLRSQKYGVEKSISKLFDKVFVGSKYHQNKLGWNNTEVLYLPLPPYPKPNNLKLQNIITVARPGIQKVNKRIEKIVKKEFGLVRAPVFHTFREYYDYLATFKIMLITSKEETFGYQVVDAIHSGVIPLAPRCCSYPELLPNEYLYSDIDELRQKIAYYLQHYNVGPQLNHIEDSLLFYSKLGRQLCQK